MKFVLHATLVGCLLVGAGAKAQPPGMGGGQPPQAAPTIDVDKTLSEGPKGTLAVRAVQGTKGGPAIGEEEVEVDLYHRDRPVAQFKTKLDANGMVLIRDLPVAMAVRPLVRVKHADATYQQAGPALEQSSPNAAMEVTVYETTDTMPAWRVLSRQVMIAPLPGELDIVETVVVENPGDRTWIGAPADAQGRRATTAFTLPEKAADVQLETGFHGWCCTAFAARTLTVQMPLMPGKAMYRFSYRVPSEGGKADAFVGAAALSDSLVFYMPEEFTSVDTKGLVQGPSQTIEGTNVKTFVAKSVTPGSLMGVSFSKLDTIPAAAAAPDPAAASVKRATWWDEWGPLTIALGSGLGIVVGALMLYLRAPGDKSAKRRGTTIP